MLGVIVNVGTVLLGSLVGLFLKRGIPEKVTEALMIGIGLCTVFIGISGALQGENTLVLILSMAIGTVIGTLLDIDRQLNRLAAYVENRFKQKDGPGYGGRGVCDGKPFILCGGDDDRRFSAGRSDRGLRNALYQGNAGSDLFLCFVSQSGDRRSSGGYFCAGVSGRTCAFGRIHCAVSDGLCHR